jgi:hypothetical protein
VFTVNNLYQLDPANVTLSEDGMPPRCEGLAWGGQQQHCAGRVEAQISRDGEAYVWQVQATHAEPIKVIKLMLWGLPPHALEQGWWQPTSTAGRSAVATQQEPMCWMYPWREWLTPWACAGQTDGAPQVVISFRDAEVRAKRLYTHLPPYSNHTPVVEVIFEEDATHWGSQIATCAMRLTITKSRAQMDADFEAHRRFIEAVYGLQPWETRSDVPEWMREIKLSGVFLDTSGCWFNDPRHNLFSGYWALIQALHERHPDLLIAGEGWYDAILGVMPVNQSWLRTDRRFIYPQLLSRYGRALGHLAEGAPGPVSTGVHEGGYRYRRDGVATPVHIPSIGIMDDTLTHYREELIALCKQVMATQ